MDDWLQFASLFSVGLFAGVLNVTAGGGSFLTLPLLIFLGYPPIEANGTNRVGIFLQNLGAVWSFNRQGLVDLSWMRWAMGPGLLGCLLGTWLALVVDADDIDCPVFLDYSSIAQSGDNRTASNDSSSRTSV